MKKSIIWQAATLITILSTHMLRAQTDVYWNFNSPGALPASGVFPGLTVGPVTQGNNNGLVQLITSNSPSSGYTTAAGFAASGQGNAESAVRTNAPFNNTTYLAFSTSLSALANANYTINDVSFGSLSTLTGPRQLALYGSTDGFNSIFTALGSLNAPTNNLWQAYDFSGLAIQLPDDGSTYSFRIYASISGNNFVNNPPNNVNWRIDDLTVQMVGTPEPTTLALFIPGVLACLCFLRCKNRSAKA